jgi:protein SCO1
MLIPRTVSVLLRAACIGAAALIAACTPAAAPVPPTGSGARDTGIAVSGGTISGCLSRAYPDIGGPIALTDHTGRPVTEADYMGRASLVFFGFTYCPDVCPTTLVTLDRALALMPDGAPQPRVMLISVDPARDTPEKLGTYITTGAFPDDLTGLTGSPTAIRAAADAFIADYSRIEDPGSAALYTMDHTSLIYLMDADWKLKTFFTHEDTPETIAACLTEVAD